MPRTWRIGNDNNVRTMIGVRIGGLGLLDSLRFLEVDLGHNLLGTQHILYLLHLHRFRGCDMIGLLIPGLVRICRLQFFNNGEIHHK